MCAIALALGVSVASAEDRALSFSPSSWDVGVVRIGAKVDLSLVVQNTSASVVSVSLIPTCGCLSVAPSHVRLRPGGRAEMLLSFRPDAGPDGDVEESFLVQTDVKGQEWQYYRVHGRAIGSSGNQ